MDERRNDRDIRAEIQKVGQAVGLLRQAHETDRVFLQQLHADHLRLESRVKASEDNHSENQHALDKHIEVAELAQRGLREDFQETKEILKGHIKDEDKDRREMLAYLRAVADNAKKENWTNLKWAGGIAAVTIGGLFTLLWATGVTG